MEKGYTESTDSSGRGVTLDILAGLASLTSSFYHSAASPAGYLQWQTGLMRGPEQHYCTPHSSHTESNGVTTSD